MTTDTSEKGLESLICIAMTGHSCEPAQLPDEVDDKEPIDEGRALADDAGGDLHDAGNFKEELAMESEVRA